jgi:hypothetical protein
MKTRDCLVIAVLLEAACGSNNGPEIDASGRVLDDAAMVAEAPPTWEAGLAVDVEIDASPSADLASDGLTVDLAGDVPRALEAMPAYNTGLDATLEEDGEGGRGCNAESFEDTPPPLLSQTGCFEPGRPDRPMAAFFPYEVNSPLWSDGAAKSRFLMIPPGSVIKVKDCDQAPTLCLPVDQGGAPEDEGHFDLPVGSIVIKMFALQGKPIETRFLVRVSTALWNRYSYEWNDDATEASLLFDSKDRTVGAQVWHYPSQQECIQCHTAAAGRSLGLTSRQLDRVTAGTNQLDRMVASGLLPTRPKTLGPYPDPRLPGPVADRARAYLQTNCSFCHRPAGPFSDMDMRYDTALFDMHLCNVPSVRGAVDANVPPVRLLPGAPSASAVSFRMHNRSGYAMPRLGSNLVDPDGVAVVDQWISGLTDCPSSP